jgi:hypothetical protein
MDCGGQTPFEVVRSLTVGRIQRMGGWVAGWMMGGWMGWVNRAMKGCVSECWAFSPPSLPSFSAASYFPVSLFGERSLFFLSLVSSRIDATQNQGGGGGDGESGGARLGWSAAVAICQVDVPALGMAEKVTTRAKR